MGCECLAQKEGVVEGVLPSPAMFLYNSCSAVPQCAVLSKLADRGDSFDVWAPGETPDRNAINRYYPWPLLLLWSALHSALTSRLGKSSL